VYADCAGAGGGGGGGGAGALVGGSAGSGAGSTVGVPVGAAYAGMLTAAMGVPRSTPATAIFVMLLRTPDDRVQVIAQLPFTGCRISHYLPSDPRQLMFPLSGSIRQVFIQA
jgi:hypothetical protein